MRGGGEARLLPVLAALIAFVVYVPRLAPGVTILGDSAVFVSAAVRWGVPQPSGYPLFTDLGWLFSRLPFGDVAWRVHLSSAVYHAATVCVVAATIFRLTRSHSAALGGSLFLAFSRAFFHGSLYAEAFPLNDLFTALTLALAVRLWEQGAPPTRSPAEPELFGFAFVSGLATAHHQMIALAAPALAVILWRSGAWKAVKLRTLPALAATFAAPPVALYALLLVAARRARASMSGPSWGDVHDLASLWALVTRRDYGGVFSPHLGAPRVDAAARIEAYGDAIRRHFGVLGLGLAVFGAWWLARRHRAVAVAIVLLVIVSGPAFAVANRLEVDTEHGVAFADRFCTMSEVGLALLVGSGVAALESSISARVAARWGLSRYGVAVLAALAFLPPLLGSAGEVDLRDDRLGAHLAHDVIASTADDAIVLTSGDAVYGATMYACVVERRCGGRIVFGPGQLHLPWRVEQLRRQHPDLVLPARGGPPGTFPRVREVVAANLGRRPLDLTPQLLELETPLREAFQYVPEGLLVRVLLDDAALVAEAEPLGIRARGLARGVLGARPLEGASVRRTELRYPSLETVVPEMYALAYENHARMLRALAEAPDVVPALEEAAEAMDPGMIRRLRGGGER